MFQLVSVLDVHTNTEGIEVVMRKQLDSIYGHQSSRSGRFSPFVPLGVLASVVLALITGTAFVLPYLRSQAAASGSVSYYVSPSGNDTNDGSQTAPFATINKAASVATPGTTVHVLPGTYTTTVDIAASGTATARITYLSDVKWGAKIKTTGSGFSFRNWGSYVDIVGFDITGDGSWGIYNNGSYVRMIGNEVHDIPATNCSGGGAGIHDNEPPYGGHDNDEIGNVVHDIGSLTTYCNLVHGIYKADPGGHIYNNIVYRNAAWGIHLYHAATKVTVANNLVFANHGGGILIGADSSKGYIDDYTTVSNNTVIHNVNPAIIYTDGIYESSGTGIHNQYLHNISYDNHANVVLQNGLTDVATLQVDPQLVSYQPDGSGDYHLAAGSPAIDSGTGIGAPTYDFDGNPRPQGNGIDIGPYQHVVATTVTPTSAPIPSPTASPAPTLLPTDTPTPALTASPTSTLLPTNTPAPTLTGTPTPTLLPTNTPTPTLTPTPILNLIQNGSFENTGSNWLAPWGFQSRGIATIKQVNSINVDGAYSARVSITKSRSADNAVQLYQGNLPLTQGTAYTIVFWAKASALRSIRLAVAHGASPWSSYFSRSVNITESWQQYTLTFTAPQTDSNGMLIFNLANATGYVWIDNVSLRRSPISGIMNQRTREEAEEKHS